MSHDIAIEDRQVMAPMADCWRHVGVTGDRSCPELKTFIHCRNCPVLSAAARRFFDRPAPAGYLESWREILEQPEVTVDADARSVLIFRLGTEWLALPTAAVVEVTPLRQVHRLPHRSGPVLAGIVNIRGQLQLCVRLQSTTGHTPPLVSVSDAAPAHIGCACAAWRLRAATIALVTAAAGLTKRARMRTGTADAANRGQM